MAQLRWNKGEGIQRGERHRSYTWTTPEGYKVRPDSGGRYTPSHNGNSFGVTRLTKVQAMEVCQKHFDENQPSQVFVGNVPPTDGRNDPIPAQTPHAPAPGHDPIDGRQIPPDREP